ncbi:hypothetical protein AB5I39_15230 [Sphingomonas sp. MMS24-J45]|uniref:hypothetical protein n=1 Tax=Sphingomonas sp. MMS24-J45 TaxID=3238806 RepID=UPI00384C5DE7
MLLVRLGWAGRPGVAAIGWAAIVAALIALTLRDGAWGLAVGTVAGLLTALALVVQAGWVAPGRTHRAPRDAATVVLPRRRGNLARRLTVFVLVVPVGFIAAQWLAFAIQAMARRAGAGEADAIVLTLFFQPVLWGCLMAWQMTRGSVARMIVPPASAGVLGAILWGIA